MASAERIFIGLGANLGDPLAQLLHALDAVRAGAASRDLRLVGVSSLYRTAPWEASGPDFLNAVVALDGQADPWSVLAWLQALEAEAGRQRPYPNAPRTLDLDLLLHGQRVMDDPLLTLPHPRARARAFVMVPLRELAPDVQAHWPGGRADPAGFEAQAIQRLDEPRWPRHLLSSGNCISSTPGSSV